MLKGANVYYYHYDGLGSVRAITDESETTIETYTYDIYGKPTIYDASGTKITESQIGNRNYFTGREFDKETGLYYYRARYYDPTLGRFMSPDPAGPVDGPNLYTYCGNDPVNRADPEGRYWVYWASEACTWLSENFEFLDMWKDIMEEEIDRIKDGIDDLRDQLKRERKAKEKKGKKPSVPLPPQPPSVEPPTPPVKLPPFPEGENILGPLIPKMGNKKL